uniref:Uncharacterized protein n=1 Tax=Pavo cristatus TaxID=9049 RepID=A0A8C9GA31_PAVCR
MARGQPELGACKQHAALCTPLQGLCPAAGLRCRALPGAVGALCRALPPRARLAPDVLRRARFDRPQAVSPGRGPPLLPCPCGAALHKGWLNSVAFGGRISICTWQVAGSREKCVVLHRTAELFWKKLI